jgi:cysteine synthase A
MGAGTGGTLSGVAAYLKPLVSNIHVVLADPQGSGLFSKVKHGVLYSPLEAEGSRTRHQVDTIVEGVGQNRWTSNIARLFDQGLVDDAVSVKDTEAVEMSRFVMQQVCLNALIIGRVVYWV